MEASAAVVAAARRPRTSRRTACPPASARSPTSSIPAERREELQRALVRSHAAGMGPPVEREVVRAMMLLRARTLAMGRSGARPVVAETMLALLNAGITPVVPRARLARRQRRPRAARPLRAGADRRGRGAVAEGDARDAWPRAGIEPLTLAPRRASRSSTAPTACSACCVLALARPRACCCSVADITAAMSVEALLGTDRAFAADLVALRPQPGQAASAANLRALLAGSPIVASHRYGDDRVQDAYSLRCAPQVTGAARDTLAHAERVADAELASRDRQPDGAARRARRVVRQLPRRAARVRAATSSRSPRPRSARSPSAAPTGCSTPPARTGCRRSSPPTPGVNSGLMIAQYTQAAMVAENRRLAAPASVDSLPTSAMQEDHVSMGWGAARKLRAARRRTSARILAVELTLRRRTGSTCARRCSPAPGTAAALARACARASPGPGRTAGSRPTSRRPRSSCAAARCSSAVEAADRERSR